MTTQTQTTPQDITAAPPTGDVPAGRPDLTQCQVKTDKGRQCKLNAGHEPAKDEKGRLYSKGKAWEGHRMVLRENVPTPKTLAELRKSDPKMAGFKLVMSAVPKNADRGREVNREAEPRDDDQKRVDADALKSYNEWVRAGKPKDFEKPDFPVQRYIFPPAAWDTVFAMLRRAGQQGGTVVGKRLEYRKKTHEDGNAMIFFAFTDKPPASPATDNGANAK